VADRDRVARPYVPVFFTLARTGMRLGEGLALQWPDVDLAGREIRVARGFSKGRLSTPKGGHGRTVDVSQQLAGLLHRLEVERKAETLRRGWPAMPPWVFVMATGRPVIDRTVDRVFKRVVRAAGLPAHFTPHCLRHTYASLLLVDGVSPVYVQRQLGHSSIAMTCDLYGRWLPMGNKAAVDRLDGPRGSSVVAAAAPAPEMGPFPGHIAGNRLPRRPTWTSPRSPSRAATRAARAATACLDSSRR
jgi:integrase